MKPASFIGIAATSLLLLGGSLLPFFNMDFSSVFYLVVLGQICWIITVIVVLKEKHSSDKTFDDWYEDHPRKK